MFEFIAQQAQGIAALCEQGHCPHQDNPIDNKVRNPQPEQDEYDAEIARRYPSLPQSVRSQLAAYDRKVGTYGFESVLDAPVLPDRIKAMHPFAH
jgi:hypothetical protein